ncbi:unannotated protein [freshwater metagenome]|uniref:Unannotated protein n=1 Tax=freshwater metagenome TaxID=449393 RepID=A0A6J6AG87_9ZZZZ
MAQKPQLRSQPSAIFTYAHGEFDFGRGKFNKSNFDTSPVTAIGLRPSCKGTPKPATWSASGNASASSSP